MWMLNNISFSLYFNGTFTCTIHATIDIVGKALKDLFYNKQTKKMQD